MNLTFNKSYFSFYLLFCLIPAAFLFLAQGYGADFYDHIIFSQISKFDRFTQPVWTIGEIYVPRYIFLYDYLSFLSRLYIPLFLVPIILGSLYFYFLYIWNSQVKIFNAVRIALIFLGVPLQIYLSASRISLMLLVIAFTVNMINSRRKLFWIFSFLGLTSSLLGFVLGILFILVTKKINIYSSVGLISLAIFCILFNSFFYREQYEFTLSVRDLIFFLSDRNKLGIILDRFDNLAELLIVSITFYVFYKLSEFKSLILLIKRNIKKIIFFSSFFIFFIFSFSITSLSSRPLSGFSRNYFFINSETKIQCDQLMAFATFTPFTKLDKLYKAERCNNY